MAKCEKCEQDKKQRDLYRQELVLARPTDLPIPQMFSIFDYKFEMTKLYQQRQWYQWTMGTDWFNRQVERIIHHWEGQNIFDPDQDYVETRRIFEETEKEIAKMLDRKKNEQ